MNLSKRSGDKELFSGERSSKENINLLKKYIIRTSLPNNIILFYSIILEKYIYYFL
jgi:hypothetical protein